MAAAAKSDSQILLADSVSVEIGERLFHQKALSLRGTARLVAAVAEELQKVTQSPALANLLTTDLEEMDVVALLPVIVQVIAAVPDALPRIMAIVLTGDEHIEDIDFLDDNASLADALRIGRTFIEQNEFEELVENFTVLRGAVTTALERARAKAEA